MKKAIFSVFAIVVLFASTSFAQFTSGFNPQVRSTSSDFIINVAGVLDTADGTYDSLATNSFEMPGIGSNEYVQVDYLFTSTAGSPNILVDWYGSNDNSNWALVEQVVDTTTAETLTFQQTTLSNARPRYNKLIIEQVGAGRDNSAFKVWVRAKKD